MVYVSPEEKRARLEEIRMLIKNYPVVPYFKDEEQVRVHLSMGNIDFIADGGFWRGTTEGRWGIIRRIKPWGRAEIGYEIRALNIERLIQTVNYLVKQNPGVFIYFRCYSPDIPWPRRCYVEEELAVLSRLERELASPVPKVRDELYDY